MLGFAFFGAFANPALARQAHSKNSGDLGSSAAGPSSLGRHKDWSAYVRGGGAGKVCYILSEPRVKQPANVKRDPAYFLINDWPARKSKAEAEIVPGYPYKDGSTVTVKIGSVTIDFFTKNDGGSGSAWVLDPANDRRLLRAMRGGLTAVVTGTSRRGTVTQDIYGLAGIEEALDRIHDACGM